VKPLRAAVLGLGISALLAAAGLAALLRFLSEEKNSPPPAVAGVTEKPSSTIVFRLTRRDGTVEEITQRTNYWGFLGDDPPADWKAHFTVMAVGASSTHGLFLGYGRDYPARLQARLREKKPKTWVGNIGIGGHTTRAHVATMKDFVARVKPDVALFMIGGNDMFSNLGMERFVPRDHYGHLSETWRYKRILYRGAFRQTLQDIRDSLTSWARGRVLKGDNVESLPSFQPIGDARNAEAAAKALAEAGTRLADYRANVSELARLARAAGIRPMFMTQPFLFEDTEKWEGVAGLRGRKKDGVYVLSARDVARLLQRFNKALLDSCRQEKARCLDLYARVPHDAEHFVDEIHTTEKGADRIAAEAARFLLQ
jgi:lysophospholipase L1-like esterase